MGLLLQELNDELALAGIKPPRNIESAGQASKDLGMHFKTSSEESTGNLDEVSKDDLAKILRETKDVLKSVSDERRAMQRQEASGEKHGGGGVQNSKQNLTAGAERSGEDSKIDDPAYLAALVKSVLSQKDDEHARDSTSDRDEQYSHDSGRSSQDSFDSHY